MKASHECPLPETLVDFAYGELEPSEVVELEQHLETCAPCGLELRALREALELADALPGPVEPSPEVGTRLRVIVAQQQPWWKRLVSGAWAAISSPVPAYQALLGGAVLALAVQLVVSGPDSPAAHDAPRAPDPKAMTIKIQPVEVSGSELPRHELKNTVDALSPDDYAQAY